jgi:hypothetical protein
MSLCRCKGKKDKYNIICEECSNCLRHLYYLKDLEQILEEGIINYNSYLVEVPNNKKECELKIETI